MKTPEEVTKQSQLYAKLGKCHPKLSRGLAWCTSCGRRIQVKSSECFRDGWPKCCGQTMTIDSPEERVALAKEGTT